MQRSRAVLQAVFSFRAHVHIFFSHSRSYGLDMASPFRPVRSVLESSLIF
jgi:hypothetical protein